MSDFEPIGNYVAPMVAAAVPGGGLDRARGTVWSVAALEYAWSVERGDGGLALWMVTSSLERNGQSLEALRPADADGSVTAHGDDDESDGGGHGSLERVATASGEDAAAAHRPI